MLQLLAINGSYAVVENGTLKHTFPQILSFLDLYRSDPHTALRVLSQSVHSSQLWVELMQQLLAYYNLHHLNAHQLYFQTNTISKSHKTSFIRNIISLERQKNFVRSVLDQDKSIKSLAQLKHFIHLYFSRDNDHTHNQSTPSLLAFLQKNYPFILQSFLLKNRLTSQQLLISQGRVPICAEEKVLSKLYRAPNKVDYKSIATKASLFGERSDVSHSKMSQSMS